MTIENCTHQTHIVKAGHTTSGYQRCLCRICGAYFSLSGKSVGRPSIGKKPMTNAERQKRSRQKRALAAKQINSQAEG